MKVYVANTTRQVQDFVWRSIEGRVPHRMAIDVGQQVVLPGDWKTEDIKYLEEQHRRYGLVAVDEIDRTRDFIGLCFSVDKPIAVEKIRRALTTNQAVLEERGRELRKQAAVAVANQVQSAYPESGLTALEMVVQEERKDGGAPAVNEGIRVPTAGQAEGGPPAPARRRGRAAA